MIFAITSHYHYTPHGTPPSTVEQYNYDADGERVSRSHDGLTTFYLAGALEADVQSGLVVATRTLYPLQGQVVATRTPGGLFYLHGDHLGSVALSVNAATGATSSQEFDPWGAVRSGGVPQTSLNYTGQRKDGTGLLYHHARYYDPPLARWTSPDSIVPGAALGAGGARGTLGEDDHAALRPLTVDFQEPGMAAALGEEDRFMEAQGFWFQLSGGAKQKVATVGAGQSTGAQPLQLRLRQPTAVRR
jgi:RHS repeat-associated protein